MFASSEIYIPMFMSVFDPIAGVEKISCGVDDDFVVHLGATSNILESVQKEDKGFVYILNKDDLIQHDHHEWISEKPITPLFFVEVAKTDIDLKITEIV